MTTFIACPNCGGNQWDVTQTAPITNGIRRYRRCQNCGHSCSTYEQLVMPRAPWEPGAEAWLRQHCPKIKSLRALARAFNDAAAEHGWRPRTAASIKVRRGIMGIPAHRRANRRVLCLDTGETYPTATDAANALGYTPQAIRAACRGGVRCNGHRWAYIDNDEVSHV